MRRTEGDFGITDYNPLILLNFPCHQCTRMVNSEHVEYVTKYVLKPDEVACFKVEAADDEKSVQQNVQKALNRFVSGLRF